VHLGDRLVKGIWSSDYHPSKVGQILNLTKPALTFTVSGCKLVIPVFGTEVRLYNVYVCNSSELEYMEIMAKRTNVE